MDSTFQAGYSSLSNPARVSSIYGGKVGKAGEEKEAESSSSWREIKDTVTESFRDWQHMGKKVGILAAASVSKIDLKGQPLTLEALSGALMGPVGAVTTYTLLELGKKTGGFVGGALGLGKGIFKAGAEQVGLLDRNVRDKKVDLPVRREGEPLVEESKLSKFSHRVGVKLRKMAPEALKSLTFGGRVDRVPAVLTMEFSEKPFPEVKRDRLVDNFVKLLSIDAVYPHEAPVAREIGNYLKEIGVEFRVDGKGNVLGSIPASPGLEDSPAVMLSSHMDTVYPTGNRKIVNDGVMIRSDEKHILGGDNRAGIAQILEGVRTVLEEGHAHPEIKLVFTVGEEVGLLGARSLRPEDITSRPTLGYVMDSTNIRSLFMKSEGMHYPQHGYVDYSFKVDDPLSQVAIRSLADAGVKPRVMTEAYGPGGSDSNTTTFNNSLIQCFDIGTGTEDIHTPFEQVKIKELEQGARIVVALVTNSGDLRVNEENRIIPRLEVRS